MWRAHGRELFYVRPAPTQETERVQMLSVKVEDANRGLQFGTPTPLFEGAYRMNRPARSYDVSPDGLYFYLIRIVSATGGAHHDSARRAKLVHGACEAVAALTASAREGGSFPNSFLLREQDRVRFARTRYEPSQQTTHGRKVMSN